MLNTPGKNIELDLELATHCINACKECASICNFCSESFLSKDKAYSNDRWLISIINCADICLTTANLIQRHSKAHASYLRAQIYACAEICRECLEACENHLDYEYCNVCARTCQMCESICRKLLNTLPA